MEGSNYSWPRYSSLWWKELLKIGDFGTSGWFNAEVVRKVGNGLNTNFWNVKWRGESCFRTKYPRLFMISIQKDATVGEVGVETEGGREWVFRWRRNFFVWEEELLLSLIEDLEGMTWSISEDEWRWSLDETGVFSVKSAYEKLIGLVESEEVWGAEEFRVFENLWKSPTPSKVVALAWKVLINRVPTKVNLALRNVLNPEESTSCVMCNGVEESSTHLFLHRVWCGLS